MKLKLPAYNGKDNLVMLIAAPVFVLVFNLVNFRPQYFSDIRHFLAYTIVSFAIFCIYFILCGAIALFFLKMFPAEKDVFKRLSITIFIFLLNLGLVLYILFQTYEHISWFDYKYKEVTFLWNYLLLGIANICVTFFMEGLRNYSEWKSNLQETEKLDAAYRQTSLNALKSQVNPHFLFNSLNSLSSLIQEDEDKAEAFLNEMTKVYRYMLRNDDEQLVTLETELKFAASYMHLLKARYSESLQLHKDIHEEHLALLIAPLTLQVIIENAFTQNVLSKTSPLSIIIKSASGSQLLIQNNVQPKTITTNALDAEAGLDNLVKKYELMGMPLKVDDTKEDVRIITIPLTQKEEVVI